MVTNVRGMTTVLVLAASVGLGAQTTPQQYLTSARQSLDAVSSDGLDSDVVSGIAALRKDFADLQAAYAVAVGGPAAAAVTQAPGELGAGDWQSKYALADTDLLLIGDIGGQTSAQLNQFRTNLEKFFNAAVNQAIANVAAPTAAPAVPSTAACPQVAESVGREATSVLDRVETIVSDTLDGKAPTGGAVATAGVKDVRDAGRVSADRAALDEILTELTHLKLILQTSGK